MIDRDELQKLINEMANIRSTSHNINNDCANALNNVLDRIESMNTQQNSNLSFYKKALMNEIGKLKMYVTAHGDESRVDTILTALQDALAKGEEQTYDNPVTNDNMNKKRETIWSLFNEFISLLKDYPNLQDQLEGIKMDYAEAMSNYSRYQEKEVTQRLDGKKAKPGEVPVEGLLERANGIIKEATSQIHLTSFGRGPDISPFA
jgi:hypothetical protein